MNTKKALVFSLGLLSASTARAATVTLAWNASPDGSVIGYALWHKLQSGGSATRVDVGSATSGTVSNLTAGTTYTFYATSYNSSGVDSDPSNLITHTTASTPPPNTAPSLDPIADQTINVGQTLTLTAHATDADTPAQTLTFQLTQAPSGATIGGASGVFTWTPSQSQASTTNAVSIAVSDDGSPVMSAAQSFKIVVRPATTQWQYLTVASSRNGSVNINPSAPQTSSGYQYASGTTVTLTPVPKKRYEFARWTVNGVTSTDNPLSLTMTNTMAVTPFFQRKGILPGTLALDGSHVYMEVFEDYVALDVEEEGGLIEGTVEVSNDLSGWMPLVKGLFSERTLFDPVGEGAFYRLLLAGLPLDPLEP